MKVKERLPNGELIITVDGVEHRTITAEHAREIAERKVKLEAAEAKISTLERINAEQANIIGLLKQDQDVLKQILAIQEDQKKRQAEIISKQDALLAKADEILKRGRGRVSSFFNHPLVQVGLKAIVPTFNLWLSSRR